MGLVSFDSLYSDDTYQHIINCNSNCIGDKTMNKEAILTHFFMFIFGCVIMYVMVNYL